MRFQALLSSSHQLANYSSSVSVGHKIDSLVMSVFYDNLIDSLGAWPGQSQTLLGVYTPITHPSTRPQELFGDVASRDVTCDDKVARLHLLASTDL